MINKQPIVIIGCGAQKRGEACAAGAMYTGPYFTVCLRYARTLAGDDNIFILSAKHGLLRLTDQIEPYEESLRQKSLVGRVALRWLVTSQAVRAGIFTRPVIAVAGADYVRIVRLAWETDAEITTPLAGRGGIGSQMAWMKKGIERAETR